MGCGKKSWNPNLGGRRRSDGEIPTARDSCEAAREDASSARQEPAKEPLAIGSERQLFIDDFISESIDSVSKTLNQPTKHQDNPLLPMAPKGKPTWDADMPLSFSSVLYDEDDRLFKMWYGLHNRGEGDEDSLLCYATSEDGVQWRKPLLGQFECRGTKNNNIVMPHSGLA